MNNQFRNAGTLAMNYLSDCRGRFQLLPGSFRRNLVEKICQDLKEAGDCTLLRMVTAYDINKNELLLSMSLLGRDIKDLFNAIMDVAVNVVGDDCVRSQDITRCPIACVAALLLSDTQKRLKYQTALSEEKDALVKERRCMLEEARQEADRIRQEANQYDKSIRVNAERLLAKADAAAKQKISDAENQAKQILAEANNQLKIKREEAESRAEDLLNEALECGRKERLTTLLRSVREEDAVAKHDEEIARARKVEETAKTRQELCAEMSSLQVGLNKKLQEMQDGVKAELNEMTANMGATMNDWRNRLYRQPVNDLASCYIDICRIINLGEKRLAEIEQKRILIEEENAPVADDYGKLVNYMGDLLKRIRSMRKAYANLLSLYQLEIYTPITGDKFDPAWHILNESSEGTNEDMFYGYEIVACMMPGIREITDNNERRCFNAYKAEVTIRK